jgi:hypothetical protein
MSEAATDAAASVEPEVADPVTPELDDVLVALSQGAVAAAQRIASIRGISVGKAMSDALALQETVAVEKAAGARLLLERHGNVEELAG